MARTGERHPTDMAGLRGARLVAATETEQGRRWAESRLKALTGGDKITARFMRQDFFEFVPHFKLIVAGNHKPVIRNVDEAMRRRLRAEANGEFVGSTKRFSENLSSRGFEPYRDRRARGFRGLCLREGSGGTTEMEFKEP